MNGRAVATGNLSDRFQTTCVPTKAVVLEGKPRIRKLTRTHWPWLLICMVTGQTHLPLRHLPPTPQHCLSISRNPPNPPKKPFKSKPAGSALFSHCSSPANTLPILQSVTAIKRITIRNFSVFSFLLPSSMFNVCEQRTCHKCTVPPLVLRSPGILNPEPRSRGSENNSNPGVTFVFQGMRNPLKVIYYGPAVSGDSDGSGCGEKSKLPRFRILLLVADLHLRAGCTRGIQLQIFPPQQCSLSSQGFLLDECSPLFLTETRLFYALGYF